MHDPVGSAPVLQNLEATNEPSALSLSLLCVCVCVCACVWVVCVCVCVCESYRFYVGINREFAAADSVHLSNDDEYHPNIIVHIFLHDITIFLCNNLLSFVIVLIEEFESNANDSKWWLEHDIPTFFSPPHNTNSNPYFLYECMSSVWVVLTTRPQLMLMFLTDIHTKDFVKKVAES